jgi:LacI family transcriptional regulator
MAAKEHRAVVKRVSISDVARASGVSKTTVSKVMNRKQEELDVPASTRQRVLDVCRELGYQPSWRARAFARGKTYTVGLVHGDVVPFMAGELWHSMVQQLVNSLHEVGYDAQFVPAPPGTDRWRAMLLDQRLDGCLVFNLLTPEVAETLQSVDMPTVLLNAKDKRYPSVAPDDVNGARQITEHLLGLGHRAMAFVDHAPAPRHFSFFERREGFMAAMTAAGHRKTAMLISAAPDEVIGRLEALDPRPTAVVAFSDVTAMPLLQGYWRRGIRVPADLSVVTFNDTAFTRYGTPPLTTVHIPTVEMAKRAVAMLLAEMNPVAGAEEVEREVLLPESLVMRESTAAPKGQ